ncbi:hypothetical protein [Extensimonas sp. H3M7-6]|uniref:hypothetical protein n=1 Tax=Extensimonas soli TaxID=3031322 RepID=UPI0023DC935C|nr:hypothetical protein [Extensimonas sp. H3M7-6]MDF1482023.1 hypothetical protein [Extensimonas sp. H3M7-6]
MGEFLIWRDCLGGALNAGQQIMPPLPQYESFPWAASVINSNPLKMEVVFDDRYFMASSDLNLLNTLLLANSEEKDGDVRDDIS